MLLFKVSYDTYGTGKFLKFLYRYKYISSACRKGEAECLGR